LKLAAGCSALGYFDRVYGVGILSILLSSCCSVFRAFGLWSCRGGHGDVPLLFCARESAGV
ncbi:MAG TPA: hypothetical protein VE844_03805, partial [Gammaproteobacteria bacterium]|nr:hypothetical protein [Gammaproteobacteria bacterium]